MPQQVSDFRPPSHCAQIHEQQIGSVWQNKTLAEIRKTSCTSRGITVPRPLPVMRKRDQVVRTRDREFWCRIDCFPCCLTYFLILELNCRHRSAWRVAARKQPRSSGHVSRSKSSFSYIECVFQQLFSLHNTSVHLVFFKYDFLLLSK